MDKAKRKPKNEADATQEDLMWAIGFTPTDLEASREGVLSDHQRRKFQAERQTNLLTMVLCSLFAIVVWVVGQNFISHENLICLLIPVIVCVGIGLLKQLETFGYHRDLRQNRAEAVQGRVILDVSEKGKKAVYVVQLQHKVWPVKKTVFLAFKNGDPYVIYYAPHTNKILSAEWLREG
jgi:hypothetical protein